MIEFKEYTLGSVCSRLSSGKGISSSQVHEKGRFPVYGGNGLRGYTDKSNFAGECAIIGRQGAFCGNVRYFSGEAYMTEHAVVTCANEQHNTRYLAYLLSTMNLGRLSGQSAQPGLSVKTLSTQMVYMPPKKTQDQVVSVLAAFDDKIAINEQINDHLLQKAKAVFKSWFVDYDFFDEPMIESPVGGLIPESLRMIQILNLPHVLETGKRPRGGATSEGVPSIGAENVKTLGAFDASSAKYIPRDFAASMKKGKIEGYELLLYKDGGKPGTFQPHFSMFGEGFPYEEFYINEHVFKLDFFDHGYNEFAYLYMQTDYPYHWLANNGGKAAIPGINQQDVNSIWIYHPDHPKVQEFCKWVQPFFATIFTNCAQNMKMARIRDSLLPKLMSGEIDVSNIAI